MIQSISPLETPEQILNDLRTLAGNQLFQNFIAQSHSREVLQRLRVGQDAWPPYTPFDEDLHYTAHYMLWQGLQLKSYVDHQLSANEYIKQACEILEFLYGQEEDRTPDRVDQIFNAALGYYISGYYARSFVLMREVTERDDLPEELLLLRDLFQKRLTPIRLRISSILSDPLYSDSVIASNLAEASLSEDDALDRIFRASLNRAFSYFIEFPKTGRRSLLETSRAVLERGVELALRTGFTDWWWLFYCARFLLDEFDENSLWTQLDPMNGDDPGGRYVRPYVKANYGKSIPVIELWKSQTAVLPKINDPQRSSQCIKMPTSAGKTRIAELAILRFLLDTKDELNTKCIYIAPFRSLAVEIENSLKGSFHPLGVRVSELYGGFELSPIERMLMDETRVVIATPEKVDVFLRTNPEYVDQIRLVIIDEGHIINLSDRGIHYELFMHRLIRRLRSKGSRFLFLSAVLPNTEDFAEWITGDSKNVIGQDWRPSRLLLGNLTWEKHHVRLDYTESDHKPLGHDCYVKDFLVQRTFTGSKGIRRKKPYPSDISEVVAETSIQFAQQGVTLIFCTRKNSVEPLAQKVIDALNLHNSLADLGEPPLGLAIDEQFHSSIEKCIAVSTEYMGEGNQVAKCLANGFVIHHSQIPKPVRLELEELVRKRAINLIIASTTLAQGVNLPIQTVIVHGLSHGQDDDLTPLTFWNVCGRAGRGMQENEGQVLFAVDMEMADTKLKDTTGLSPERITYLTAFKRRKRIERQRELRDSIVGGYRTFRVLSSLISLLSLIKRQWKEKYNSVDVPAMCLKLAENHLEWVNHRNIASWLDVLDQELLALIDESELSSVSPDDLQTLLANSLAFLQLKTEKDPLSAQSEIVQLLFARAQFIAKNVPDEGTRKKCYRLGLPLSDCLTISNNEERLGLLLNSASDFRLWDDEHRCSYLSELVSFLLTKIGALKPAKNAAHHCWEDVLHAWLHGESPDEIVRHPEIADFVTDPTTISLFVDDVFVYKLPRGLNAVAAYFTGIAEETGFSLPEVVSYFSALLKYGVHDPVASCFLAFGLASRKLALRLAELYPEANVVPSDVLSWFLNIEPNTLLQKGFDQNDVQSVEQAQKWSRSFRHRDVLEPLTEQLEIGIVNDIAENLEIGEILVIRPSADLASRTVFLETLAGREIAQIALAQEIPSDWLIPSKISVQLVDKTPMGKETTILRVIIESL